MFIGYTFKRHDQDKSELLKALLDLDATSMPVELHRDNVESLQLDRPVKIEFTEDQRNKIFKKDKDFKIVKEDLISPLVSTQRLQQNLKQP